MLFNSSNYALEEFLLLKIWFDYKCYLINLYDERSVSQHVFHDFFFSETLWMFIKNKVSKGPW